MKIIINLKLQHKYESKRSFIKIKLTRKEKKIIKSLENFNSDAFYKMTGHRI